MRSGSLVAALAAAAALAVTTSGSAASSNVSPLDSHWLKTSVQGDTFEVTGGKLAERMGTTAKVRALGARLVKDHMKSRSDAVALATKLGIVVKTQPTQSQQWELQILGTLRGSKFDHWYAKLEILDHQQDIEETSEEITSGQSPDVKQEAQKDLPMLQMHLKLSKAAYR